jgi:CheY-like chemotaxis protein
VLVVEDNANLREMACELIRVLGHDAESAESAEQALTMLGAGYDILFSDISLPEMDGVALAHLALQRHPDLKVVFASGYGAAVDVAPALPHVVLSKPYTLRRLEEAIGQACRMPLA